MSFKRIVVIGSYVSRNIRGLIKNFSNVIKLELEKKEKEDYHSKIDTNLDDPSDRT